jgi:hypothetical protein
VKKTRTKTTPPRSTARRTPPRKVRSARRPKRSPDVAEPIPVPASAVEDALSAEIIGAEPEREFAARAQPSEPDRPLPSARRAIFFDVENTSRAEHIARVIDHLVVDRKGRRTDFIAVGNWKVIGLDTARLLARHGAQLVHSAPSVGVRDWSDLRIAVAAGVWLAGARPGDVMEIVTNDRAFDAVGDVAAGLGIAFRRLSYQGVAGAPVPPPSEEPSRSASTDTRGRRRRRGRRYGWRETATPAAAPTREPVPATRPPTPVAAELPRTEAGNNGAEAPPAEPHTAPHDEIIAVVQELIHRSPTRAVTIDTLANALKSRGFSRTPGSPRLITRLRRIKEITVSRTGMITLLAPGEKQPAAPEPLATPEPTAAPEPSVAMETPPAMTDGGAEAAPLPTADDYSEEPGDSIGNVAQPPEPRPQAQRYRQQHRGGRRRFPRTQRTPVS